jgi:CHAT domain-containing protein
LTPQELETRLSELRVRLRGDSADLRLEQLLTHLHEGLLGWARLELNGLKRLHIVPDGDLFGVPFAALRDAHTGRHLIEDLALSLSDVLNREGGDSNSKPSAHMVLLVANPRTEGGSNLPAAEREVSAIANVYGDSLPVTTLLRGQATEAAFRAQASMADIIHFAGHARAEPLAPSRSRLFLAPGANQPSDDGQLTAAELQPRFLQSALVILAACETAVSAGDHRFGISHLAGQLLRSGASGVVATVDSIPDNSGDVFVAFHRHLRREPDPALALQAAQLSALRRDQDHLSAWYRNWALPVFYEFPRRIEDAHAQKAKGKKSAADPARP